MYWLARPPYARRLAAVIIVVASVAMDLRAMGTTEHPFALADLTPGTIVDIDDVEMRMVPDGMLPMVELPLHLTRPVGAGEPLTPSLASSSGAAVPGGWVSMFLDIPFEVASGSGLLLIGAATETNPTLEVDAIVVSSRPSDGFAPGGVLVAIPRGAVGEIVGAHQDGRLTVLMADPVG
jgi:hypothetical protein